MTDHLIDKEVMNMAFEKKVWLGGDTVTAAHLNRIENGIMEAMESGGSGAGEAVLPDWNENDPTSAAYIRNRPFYKSGSATVLYQNSAFLMATEMGSWVGGTDLNAEIPAGLYDGMPVTVTVDGESEELTFAYYSNSTPACYGAGQPSQNRFGIAFYPVDSATSGQSYGRGFELMDFQNKTSKTVNVSVVSGSVNVVKIPAEFLDIPDDVVVAGEGTGSTVQGLVGTEDPANSNSATGDYAHAEGGFVSTNASTGVTTYYKNTASGQSSHAEGQSTTASGAVSHAEGAHTIASGGQSHAEGVHTTASGNQSHAEGVSTTASGGQSHAEGLGGTFTINNTTYTSGAKGTADHTEGYQTLTESGQPGNHAEGYQTRATGGAAHAEGYVTHASGTNSHAEGNGTTASGAMSHAEGNGTTASGAISHAEGFGGTFTINNTTYASGAKGTADHTEGYQTLTAAVEGEGTQGNHAEGYHTQATGGAAHAEGGGTTANGIRSHAEGSYTTASGNDSHAEGASTTASGGQSHAEGVQTTASGGVSHAEGMSTTASASYSHAEGLSTQAKKEASHVEGAYTTANGAQSHAEGNGTNADGAQSHAEGVGTTASGQASHAEGSYTTASGSASHAEGAYTTANHASQHVFGENNVEDPSTANANARGTYVEIVGNGTSSDAKSNARTLDWDGNETLAGSLTLGKGTADEVTVTAAQLKQLIAMLSA